MTRRRKVMHPLSCLPSHTQADTYLSTNLLNTLSNPYCVMIVWTKGIFRFFCWISKVAILDGYKVLILILFFRKKSSLLMTFVLSAQTLQSPSPSLRSSYILDLAIKVNLSPSRKNLLYLLQWKPLKNDEKCFLFHLKRSFRSRDIYAFVLTFWSCRKIT